MARLRLTADLDAVFASRPVDRVAVWVTYQPRKEVEQPPNPFARDEVPAPKAQSIVSIESSNFRADEARCRIRELERRLAKPLPKVERRRLGAEKEALSQRIAEWRGIKRAPGAKQARKARAYGSGYVR